MTAAKGLTIEQLNAEVARLEAERGEREAERAELERKALLDLDTARRDYYADLVARGQGIDVALQLEGKTAYDAATDAATVGDLHGAFAGWCEGQRSRRLRSAVRSQVQSGASVLGVRAYTSADLSMISGTFAEWLGSVEHHAIEAGVTERLRELIGTLPGTE